MSTPPPPQKSPAKIHGLRRPARAKRASAKTLEMSGRTLRISADAVAASRESNPDRTSFA